MFFNLKFTTLVFITSLPNFLNCYQQQPNLSPYQTPYDPRYGQTILNCVFTTDSSASTYECNALNLTTTERHQSINYLKGEHTRNRSNYDVNGLKVSSQICHYIPSMLSRILPNLKKLEITYSGLLEITAADTYEHRNLQILNLRGNRISNLDYGILKENSELTSVDFSDNFITFVSNDFFNSLNKLKYIDFSNNICVKYAPAFDNVREWEKELKRNCDVDEMKRGIIRPLWKIYQILYNKYDGRNVYNQYQSQVPYQYQSQVPNQYQSSQYQNQYQSQVPNQYQSSQYHNQYQSQVPNQYQSSQYQNQNLNARSLFGGYYRQGYQG